MQIILVSNWPPSARPVCEYGYHLVQGLADCEDVKKITVLADIYDGNCELPVPDKVEVIRCWSYNAYFTLFVLLYKVWRLAPDVCWFNITLGAFGTSIANFPVMFTPFLLRVSGIPTIVTLHNIVDLTKMSEIGKGNALTTKGAEIATWILARVPVCVILPEYRSILEKKYKAPQVYIVPHGTLGTPCEKVGVPDENVLLCFGIFGTHKKIEPLLNAMEDLLDDFPGVRMRIVGGSNSHNPTYLEDLQKVYGRLPNVDFVGYVSEEDVPREFEKATAVIMPYTTIGGASGTLIQAGMYGKPILVSDLPIFRKKNEDGYALNFFDFESVESIKRAILGLVREDKKVLANQGQKNLRAASEVSMEDVGRIYLNIIEKYLRGKNEEEVMDRSRDYVSC